jgi:hypothetical protein
MGDGINVACKLPIALHSSHRSVSYRGSNGVSSPATQTVRRVESSEWACDGCDALQWTTKPGRQHT